MARMDTAQPYDLNFPFPVRDLSTARVRLTPFIVRELLLIRPITN